MAEQLVIIPGWGGTKKSWLNFIELAGRDFEVHFIELPGFGDEPCPESVWGVKEYANFAKSKIAELKKPILMGHSFGGQVAVNLAANNPDLFSKLILSGAAVMRPKHSFKRFFFAGLAKIGKLVFRLPLIGRSENFARKYLYKIAGSPDFENTSGIKREIFKKIIRQSQTHLLGKIRQKTLVIWGEKDGYVPLGEGKKIARLIPNAELKIVENGKHGLHIQQPENLLRFIKDFLRE